jgi:predicted GNAT family acetyltransferase
MDDIQLTDNRERHRFELKLDGEVAAFAEYNELKNALLFTHTEVLPAHEGKGLGGKLVRFALDQVRERKVNAIPACPFVVGYIRKHPEYLDLLTEESRRAFLR